MNEAQNTAPSVWKRCSTCKKEISHGTLYYRCSVSTCRSKLVNLTFCSTICWDGHLGYAHHRSSYCEEEMSPAA